MEKSNTELVNSLRENLKVASSQPAPSPTSAVNGNGATNGTAKKRRPVEEWIKVDEHGVMYIPAMDADAPGLVEEREEYDITGRVRLFWIGIVTRNKL